MISARFRAGETSARLTWTGRTTGSRRREPVAATGPEGPVIRVAAGQVIQGRSVLGSAGLLRSPSTSLLSATRLHHRYTDRNSGESAKPARCLLTEPFRLYTWAAS